MAHGHFNNLFVGIQYLEFCPGNRNNLSGCSVLLYYRYRSLYYIIFNNIIKRFIFISNRNLKRCNFCIIRIWAVLCHYIGIINQTSPWITQLLGIGITIFICYNSIFLSSGFAGKNKLDSFQGFFNVRILSVSICTKFHNLHVPTDYLFRAFHIFIKNRVFPVFRSQLHCIGGLIRIIAFRRL